MWNRAGVCLLLLELLVASTSARPSKEQDDLNLENPLDAGIEENGEYGEYFEGDIELPEGEPHNMINALNAVSHPSRTWPSGILPYTIKTEDYTKKQISKIRHAISDLVNLTKVNGSNCIQIIRRSTEVDYVEVFAGKGCSSRLGNQRMGKQELSLCPKNCVSKHGTIMHEFLHALGFIHEQSRPDRNDYVTINWDHIKPEYMHNFKKTLKVDLLATSYDYRSVMHYSANAFAIDPTIPTIIPRYPNAEIGQRVTLSALDIERVQILYGCLAAADSRFFKHLDPK